MAFRRIVRLIVPALVAATALLTAGVASAEHPQNSQPPDITGPNPPAVGNPDTIGERTILFVGMIVLSVLLGIAAVILGRRLAPGWGNWNASITAGVAFVAVMAVTMAVLPSGDNTPKGFPANDLWEFRIASIGTQAVLWAAFGLLFGYLAERVLEPRVTRGKVSALAA